jgi:hypothetical protein
MEYLDWVAAHESLVGFGLVLVFLGLTLVVHGWPH